MARAAEDREEPRRQRSEDRDLLRVVAQELLCVLEHDRETARRLQEAGAGDDRKDREHDADWRRARLIAKDECEDDETDAADDSQTNTAVAHAKYKAGQQYDETKQHFQVKLPFL